MELNLPNENSCPHADVQCTNCDMCWVRFIKKEPAPSKGSEQMNKLTKRDEFGNADIIGVDSADLQCNLDFDEMILVTNALNRLAEYEETGRSPKEKEPTPSANEISSSD